MPLPKIKLPEFARDKDGGTRDFVAIVDESLVNECQEARQMLWIVDVTIETKPFGVSTWTVPEASGDFCNRGGRFGTHSSNENMPPMYAGRVIFLAHFNAGVRAIDIRDPFHPREVAYFIPPITDKTTERCVKVNNADRCKTAIQTNNVEVDDRGYIYAADRANTGLHILELAGEARKPTQVQMTDDGGSAAGTVIRPELLHADFQHHPRGVEIVERQPHFGAADLHIGMLGALQRVEQRLRQFDIGPDIRDRTRRELAALPGLRRQRRLQRRLGRESEILVRNAKQNAFAVDQKAVAYVPPAHCGRATACSDAQVGRGSRSPLPRDRRRWSRPA